MKETVRKFCAAFPRKSKALVRDNFKLVSVNDFISFVSLIGVGKEQETGHLCTEVRDLFS